MPSRRSTGRDPSAPRDTITAIIECSAVIEAESEADARALIATAAQADGYAWRDDVGRDMPQAEVIRAELDATTEDEPEPLRFEDEGNDWFARRTAREEGR
jgi:hypothetical protein